MNTDAIRRENEWLRRQIGDLESRVAHATRSLTNAEMNEIGAVQARYDSVAAHYGEQVSQPLPGEMPLAYRRRLAGHYALRSTSFRDADVSRLDSTTLTPIESVIIAEATSAAKSPANYRPGVLHAVKERDEAGRMITRFVGDNLSWMQLFMTPGAVCHLGRVKIVSDDIFGKLDIPTLEKLHTTYKSQGNQDGMARCDAAIQARGHMQTPDAYNSGRLFSHKVQLDPSGLGTRPAIAWSGDPLAWMAPFMTPGAVGRFRPELSSGKNSPAAKALAARTHHVVLNPGERIQIVKD